MAREIRENKTLRENNSFPTSTQQWLYWLIVVNGTSISHEVNMKLMFYFNVCLRSPGGGANNELNMNINLLVPNALLSATIAQISKPCSHLCCTTPLIYQLKLKATLNVKPSRTLGWVKFYFFPLLAKYSQSSARTRSVTRISFTIQQCSVANEKIAQIHTNTQRMLLLTSCQLLRMVTIQLHVPLNGTSRAFSTVQCSHRRVHRQGII